MSDSGKAVFLSYASQDAEAARRICEALRAAGIEVWFDQSELRGGDAWDQKIRKQIKECTLFVPVISANTQARREGYFRREWNLACHRLLDMTPGTPFLVPVVVDATADRDALVPEEFARVQWTRLAHGQVSPQFIEQIQRLLAPASATSSGNPEAFVGRGETLTRGGHVASLGTATRKRVTAWPWAIAACAAVALAGVVYFTTQKQAPSRDAKPHSQSPKNGESASAKAIAVLPFANLSREEANESLADGMHDDVITALSKIHDLTVISRTSVMPYKRGARNLRQIAGELGVGTVLEGSVQRAGSKVRLNVQLIDARTDVHLWAENYTEELSDVFAVQSRLAAAITSALQARLSPQEKALIARRPSANREAHALYQRARFLQQESNLLEASRADHERIAQLYEDAIAKDPNFALAYAELSMVHAHMFWFDSIDPTPQRRAQAEAALGNARRLAPDAPETQLAQGYYDYACRQDWVAALGHYRRAEAGLPNDAELIEYMGYAHRRLGQWAEALAAFERAALLNANNRGVGYALLEVAYGQRHPRRTLEIAQRYLVRFPGDRTLEGLRITMQYQLDGNRAAYVRALAALPPPAWDTHGLNTAYFNALRAGDLPAADSALADARMGPTVRQLQNEWMRGAWWIGDMEPTHVHRAYVALLAGRQPQVGQFADSAIASLNREKVRGPALEGEKQMRLAQAFAFTGRLADALEQARKAVSLQKERDAWTAALLQRELARILVLADQRDEALQVLREILAGPVPPIPDEVRHDPIWSRHKDDPRFKEILRAAEAAIRNRS